MQHERKFERIEQTNNSFVPTMPSEEPANFLIASIDAVATCSSLHTITKRDACQIYPYAGYNFKE